VYDDTNTLDRIATAEYEEVKEKLREKFKGQAAE